MHLGDLSSALKFPELLVLILYGHLLIDCLLVRLWRAFKNFLFWCLRNWSVSRPSVDHESNWHLNTFSPGN